MLTDDLGYSMQLPHVQRVVSLVPSLTEAIALSNPQLLVGCTQWCVAPANMDEIAGHPVRRVRGTKNPDLAAIQDIAPDLVVANQEENRRFDIERLREAGIPVWVTRINTVNEALTSLDRLITEALGCPQPAWLDQAHQSWEQPVPTTRARVIVAIWRDPWMVAGPDTYIADVLAQCGITLTPLPIDDWEHARYPRIELDELQQADADLVVLMDAPYPFSPTDGPECFPDAKVTIAPERALAWYGPAMVDARSQIDALMKNSGFH